MMRPLIFQSYIRPSQFLRGHKIDAENNYLFGGYNNSSCLFTSKYLHFYSMHRKQSHRVSSSFILLSTGRVVSRYFATAEDLKYAVNTDNNNCRHVSTLAAPSLQEQTFHHRRRYRTEYRQNIACRYQKYKYRATVVKHIEWSLTLEQCTALFTQPCAYCRRAPIPGVQLSGIDRIDSSKGYTMDNVVSCCKQCNYAKGVYSKDDFITMCRQIAEHHKLPTPNQEK